MTLKRTIQLLCFVGLTAASVSGYAHHRVSLTADVGYVAFGNEPTGSSAINPIRLQALKEAAMTLGARGALAWRSLQIDHSLMNESNYLDQVFNFNQLLLNHNVLPPVLVQADNSLNLANPDTIRLASKIYKIKAPARFVTAPPTWRTYLLMHYTKPTMPAHSLLPTNQAQTAAWNAYFKQGWQQGLQQANRIFAVNLARLKRDYLGMVLYRKLYTEHMVSAPFVAQTNLGVTGNSHQLRIDDRVMRITAASKLQVNSSKWTPVIAK